VFVAALVPGFVAAQFLKFVDLTGNELEEEGAIALAAGLKDNKSIQVRKRLFVVFGVSYANFSQKF
jgi:hypothetical protein